MPKRISTRELSTMNIVQLVAYFNKDWDSPEPLLKEEANLQLWEDALRLKAVTSTALEILQALHEHDKESDEHVESIYSLRELLVDSFLNDHFEQFQALQNTVQILLDHHKHDNAGVTVGQLNQISGGI